MFIEETVQPYDELEISSTTVQGHKVKRQTSNRSDKEKGALYQKQTAFFCYEGYSYTNMDNVNKDMCL